MTNLEKHQGLTLFFRFIYFSINTIVQWYTEIVISLYSYMNICTYKTALTSAKKVLQWTLPTAPMYNKNSQVSTIFFNVFIWCTCWLKKTWFCNTRYHIKDKCKKNVEGKNIKEQIKNVNLFFPPEMTRFH